MSEMPSLFPPAAVPAWHALAAALDGVVTPCSTDRDAWFSDDVTTLLKSADACLDCPAMVACSAYADAAGERHGCWGGDIRDRKLRDRAEKRTAAA